MPIGKDSITKRVAKPASPESTNAPAKKSSPSKTTATEEKNIAPELVATVAAAPAPKKSSAKKPAAPTAKKTVSAAKKPAVKVEKLTPPTADQNSEMTVETAVLANISPETVKAVIGHAENEKYEKVQIGQKMPDFLL